MLCKIFVCTSWVVAGGFTHKGNDLYTFFSYNFHTNLGLALLCLARGILTDHTMVSALIYIVMFIVSCHKFQIVNELSEHQISPPSPGVWLLRWL